MVLPHPSCKPIIYWKILSLSTVFLMDMKKIDRGLTIDREVIYGRCGKRIWRHLRKQPLAVQKKNVAWLVLHTFFSKKYQTRCAYKVEGTKSSAMTNRWFCSFHMVPETWSKKNLIILIWAYVSRQIGTTYIRFCLCIWPANSIFKVLYIVQ